MSDAKPAVEPHNWTDGGDKVLILRRVGQDRKSKNDFLWPESGMVEAPDWNPEMKCGHGLHGWAWGMAMGEGMDYDIIGDVWLVVAVLPDDVVGNLQGGWKCKFKRGEIAYSGPFAGAWAMVNSGRHRLIEAMSKADASGRYSSKAASSGYSSKAASSGNSSTAASSGDYSTAASSGNSSTAASSGNSSKAASSGNSSKAASSGDSSKAASSGDYSKAASSGDSSTAASSGYSSTAASSGDSSTAEASGENTLACVAGKSGKVKVGKRGAFAIPYFTDADGWRYLCGKVGEDGIEANVWYCVTDGKIARAS